MGDTDVLFGHGGTDFLFAEDADTLDKLYGGPKPPSSTAVRATSATSS